MTVNYNGAAVNRGVSSEILRGVGASMGRFEMHSFDAVPQIIGRNTMNPLKIGGSVLAAPLLGVGGEWSPHTFRGGGDNLNKVVPRR